MAVFRERPYARFNYQVEWDGLDPGSPSAGFSEVSGLGLEIDVIEYRAGNERTNTPRKITGLHKVSDVTLKRGVLGAADLFEWLRAVRDGDQDQLRDVRINLLSENREEIVASWRLRNARPLKYTGPTLNAMACDEVAIEELTLSCEGLDFE